MTTALAIMRLQPMHNGHKLLIDTMLSENNKCVVLVGSANKQDERNPYSAEQRIEMVKSVYPNEAQTGKLIVGKIDDINNPPMWARHVISEIGFTPDVYYCGTEYDGRLFSEHGIKTKVIGRTEKPISSTMIREKISTKDDSWESFVPTTVKQLINKGK